MNHSRQISFQAPRLTPVVKVLLVILFVCFLLQIIFDNFLSVPFTASFSFVPRFFVSGYVWQIATYAFLHGGVLHLLTSGLGIYFLGTQMENYWGSRTFLKFYLVSALGGAFLHLLIWLGTLAFVPSSAAMLGNVQIVGASGALYGILMAFGLIFGESYLYLFAVVPIKAKHFVIGLVAISILTPLSNPSDGVAHLVHLGGLLTAYLYIKWRGPTLKGGSGGFRKRKMTREEVRQRLSVVSNDPKQGDRGLPIHWN